MKKGLLLISLLFFVCACSNDVKKAKDFMASGMYPQAIELLDKAIHEKPADAEAHFQLGVCFVNTGNYRRAEERFASAVRLKADYGFKIGGVYKKAGMEQLDKNINSATRLLDRVIHYQPDLKEGMCQDFIIKAQQEVNAIDSCLATCEHFQCSTNKFAEIYYSASQKTDGTNDKITYLQKASALDSQYKPYLAREMFKKASNTRNIEERLYLLNEVVLLTDKSLPYLQVLLNEFKKLKKEKSLKKMRVLVKKYGNSLSSEDREFLAPAPTWQKVSNSEIKVIGKGFGHNDVLLIKIPNLKKGDKFIVFCSKFQREYPREWRTFKQKQDFIQGVESKYPIPFKAPKGEELVIYVERLL